MAKKNCSNRKVLNFFEDAIKEEYFRHLYLEREVRWLKILKGTVIITPLPPKEGLSYVKNNSEWHSPFKFSSRSGFEKGTDLDQDKCFFLKGRIRIRSFSSDRIRICGNRATINPSVQFAIRCQISVNQQTA